MKTDLIQYAEDEIWSAGESHYSVYDDAYIFHRICYAYLPEETKFNLNCLPSIPK